MLYSASASFLSLDSDHQLIGSAPSMNCVSIIDFMLDHGSQVIAKVWMEIRGGATQRGGVTQKGRASQRGGGTQIFASSSICPIVHN